MAHDPNRPTTYGATERDINRAADQTRESIDRTADQTHASIDYTAAQAHDTADSMRDKAQQTASDAKAKAQEVASDAKAKAQELSEQAADKADAATTTAGARMSDAAQTLREKAPATGTVATVADKTADTLEQAGTYLQQHDVADMRSDLEAIIRRHPMEAVLVGFGIGFLLARSTRR